MHRVAENVFNLGTRSHNFYLLADEDEVTVIDAGCRREWSKLEDGLRAAGLAVEQVAGFVITHLHADHFGLAKQATDRTMRVTVHADDESRALGTYEGRFAAKASDLPLFRFNTLKNLLPMMFAGVTTLDAVDHVETFNDGQRLDVPGNPVVIHTPGHTEGHVMFHCPDMGILFTGDGLITMQLLGSHRGPQMIEDVFSLDPTQASASLDRIVDLEADLLLPGHGEAWAGTPADAVAIARS